MGCVRRTSASGPANSPPYPEGRLARPPGRDHFVVTVAVELRVEVESPVGETVVPLEVEPDELVILPLASTLDDLWLLVSVEDAGAGTTGAVVDCVDVELEDEVCAKAAPVIREAATVAASSVLIMSNSPGRNQVRAGIARCPSG
jgi:hypothetical protein